jgi:hypothetical protein
VCRLPYRRGGRVHPGKHIDNDDVLIVVGADAAVEVLRRTTSSAGWLHASFWRFIDIFPGLTYLSVTITKPP